MASTWVGSSLEFKYQTRLMVALSNKRSSLQYYFSEKVQLNSGRLRFFAVDNAAKIARVNAS